MATARLKPGKLSEVRSVLTNRRFAAYTCCNSISMIGVWAQRLAVGLLTWQLTESESWIGAIAFADLLPVVLVGPLAGAINIGLLFFLVLFNCMVAAGKTPSGLIYQGSASTFEDATGVTAEQPMALQDLSVASHIDEYYEQMDVYAI